MSPRGRPAAVSLVMLSTSLVILAWLVTEVQCGCGKTINHAYLAGATTAEYPGTCTTSTQWLNCKKRSGERSPSFSLLFLSPRPSSAAKRSGESCRLRSVIRGKARTRTHFDDFGVF